MLLLDANVLLYAVDESSRNHSAAKQWLDGALSASEPVALPWIVLLAFLRVSTHHAVAARPLSAEQATEILEGWLGCPVVVTLEPTRRHLPILAGLLQAAGTAGNLVNDAHLAALALEHAATIVSYDRDFGRFAGVSWREPG